MLTVPAVAARLFLIRHGEVEETYHQVFGGSRINMGLSAVGHDQAAALGQWLSAQNISAIHASPMLRVKQTMQPFVSQSGLMPMLHDGLREMDFGAWTGHHWQSIQDTFGVSAYDWLEVISRGELPEGESAAHLSARVLPALEQIMQGADGQNVAIVCHGGIIRVMLAALLDVPLTKMGRVEIDYCSVTEISLREQRPLLVELMNFCPWRK
jgi:broad specificity phosphatase PhoE